jgi:hypothetical protein
MSAIKLLAETPETVTLSRSDLDALIDAVENAADIASVRAWRVCRRGRARRGDSEQLYGRGREALARGRESGSNLA